MTETGVIKWKSYPAAYDGRVIILYFPILKSSTSNTSTEFPGML